jgi:hypothetical protein
MFHEIKFVYIIFEDRVVFIKRITSGCRGATFMAIESAMVNSRILKKIMS